MSKFECREDLLDQLVDESKRGDKSAQVLACLGTCTMLQEVYDTDLGCALAQLSADQDSQPYHRTFAQHAKMVATEAGKESV